MRELKHGEEDEVMCKSVEEYAERKAKEAAEKVAKEANEKAIEEKKATVNNLYDMGMDISFIAKAINMDEKIIKQWLDK